MIIIIFSLLNIKTKCFLPASVKKVQFLLSLYIGRAASLGMKYRTLKREKSKDVSEAKENFVPEDPVQMNHTCKYMNIFLGNGKNLSLFEIRIYECRRFFIIGFIFIFCFSFKRTESYWWSSFEWQAKGFDVVCRKNDRRYQSFESLFSRVSSFQKIITVSLFFSRCLVGFISMTTP